MPDSPTPVPDSRVASGPFEVTVTKGLFSLGINVDLDQMGMICVKNVASRSPVGRDGNIW